MKHQYQIYNHKCPRKVNGETRPHSLYPVSKQLISPLIPCMQLAPSCRALASKIKLLYCLSGQYSGTSLTVDMFGRFEVSLLLKSNNTKVLVLGLDEAS